MENSEITLSNKVAFLHLYRTLDNLSTCFHDLHFTKFPCILISPILDILTFLRAFLRNFQPSRAFHLGSRRQKQDNKNIK
jgi:hypothetical protein